MRRLISILIIISCFFSISCNKAEKIDCYNGKGKLQEKEEKNDSIKVNIEIDKTEFHNESVRLIAKVNNNMNKEIKYHWILEQTVYAEGQTFTADDNIEGLVGGSGHVIDIITEEPNVEFSSYAEVSYVDGAYRENKIILQIEEVNTGKVLSQDEILIENRQGIYNVATSEDRELINSILKSDKVKIYAKAFDIIWDIDAGVNSGIKYINVDTSSFIDLTEEQKEQLKDYLEEKYKLVILDKTFDELESEGYIENMGFKEGIMFKANNYITNNNNEISFEGMKWVGGCGAIGFIATASKYNGKWILNKCQNTWIS